MSRFPSDQQAIRAGKQIVLAAVLVVVLFVGVEAVAIVGTLIVVLSTLGEFRSAHALDSTVLLTAAFILHLVMSIGLAFAWATRWQRVGVAFGAWFGAFTLMLLALTLVHATLLAAVLAVCAGAATVAMVWAGRLRQAAG